MIINMSRQLQCKECGAKFNLTLPCGHSYCNGCFTKLKYKTPRTLDNCPECIKYSKMGEETKTPAEEFTCFKCRRSIKEKGISFENCTTHKYCQDCYSTNYYHRHALNCDNCKLIGSINTPKCSKCGKHSSRELSFLCGHVFCQYCYQKYIKDKVETLQVQLNSSRGSDELFSTSFGCLNDCEQSSNTFAAEYLEELTGIRIDYQCKRIIDCFLPYFNGCKSKFLVCLKCGSGNPIYSKYQWKCYKCSHCMFCRDNYHPGNECTSHPLINT